MRYRLDYLPSAERELAAVWVASADRAGVTAAVDAIERELARTPLTAGESRESPLVRLVINSSVGLIYEVIPDDYRVVVLSVFAA